VRWEVGGKVKVWTQTRSEGKREGTGSRLAKSEDKGDEAFGIGVMLQSSNSNKRYWDQPSKLETKQASRMGQQKWNGVIYKFSHTYMIPLSLFPGISTSSR
jgi:hypothetical protein